jgi:hypothetical protein
LTDSGSPEDVWTVTFVFVAVVGAGVLDAPMDVKRR